MRRSSTRRYQTNVHPTERDRALFAHLGGRGVASLVQLHARFWPHATIQTCRDRLKLLVAGGYLHTMTTTARGASEPIFWIERKAALLFSDTVRSGFLTGQPAAAEIAHLLRTADVLDALERRHQLVRFTHEHGLKSQRARGEHAARHEHRQHAQQGSRGAHGQVADAAVTLAQDGREMELFIEIDGAYYGKRLASKIRALAASTRPVLWVVYSDRRLATIQRLTAAYPSLHPVLFSRL